MDLLNGACCREGIAIIATGGMVSAMDAEMIARVRQILDSTPLKDHEVADAIATTGDKLSKSLNGKRRFTTTELALVAELGQTTVEWILTGQHRPSPAIAARTTLATPPSITSVQAIASRFSDASEQLSMLAESPRKLQSLPDMPVTWSYVEKANALARSAHEMVAKCGMSSTAEPDLAHVIETVFDTDVAVVELPTGLDGCSWQTEETRLIMLNSGTGWARQRFTLAHELGHILACDAQELISEAVNVHSSLETEKRANAFAAAFLMPEDEVEQQIAGRAIDDALFRSLVCHFRVSPLALAYRLSNLRHIPQAAVNRWRDVSAENCALAVNNYNLISVEGARFNATRIPPRLLLGHLEQYNARKTSTRPLAALLGRDASEIAELLHPVEAV